MALPDEVREANQWKPGQSGNPLGNALDRHSTKRFTTLINEILDNEEVDFEDLRKTAKTAKAREAVTMALVKKAMGTGAVGDKPDTQALKLLMEWADGKLEDKVDVTTKGEKIGTAADSKLQDMLNDIKGAKPDA